MGFTEIFGLGGPKIFKNIWSGGTKCSVTNPRKKQLGKGGRSKIFE